MKPYLRLLHTLLLSVVTLAAVSVMWLVSRGGGLSAGAQESLVSPLSDLVRPKPRVAVADIEPQTWPIYAVYSGRIRAWETYTVGFEIAGRVAQLGKAASGALFDEGDHVRQGDVLARLDDEVLRRRVEETSARRELAESEKVRADRLREQGSITEAEHLRRLTEAAQARALHRIAEEQLADATLRAPASGTISRRHVNAGETVAAHSPAFEIVVDDRVLLVVQVPESEIRELEERFRGGEEDDAEADQTAGKPIPAVVYLEGRNRFGERWPRVEGNVHRIDEVADAQWGTFAVEIELPNQQGLLRPGMVATAWIETARVEGYRLSEGNVVFRRDRAQIFTVQPELRKVEALYFQVGEATQFRARSVEIDRFIEQRPLPDEDRKRSLARLAGSSAQPDLIVPLAGSSLKSLEWLVVRGQHRLTDGQLVRVVNRSEVSLDDGYEQTAERSVSDRSPM